LLEANCPGILSAIADKLADSVGSTRKFVEFTLHFLPPAPTIRPPKSFQVDWGSLAFRKMLRTTRIDRKLFIRACPFQRRCAKLRPRSPRHRELASVQ
jgi:hypothetical protein